MQILARLACFHPAKFGCRFSTGTTIFVYPVTCSLAYSRLTLCEASNKLGLEDVWSKHAILSQTS
jgi:hypothetical protein